MDYREAESVVYAVSDEKFKELCERLIPDHSRAFALVKEGVYDPQVDREVGEILNEYFLMTDDLKVICRVISKRFHLEHAAI